MSSEKSNEADGRRLRSERSRAAIVDAALEMIREGVLVPTAQQISDRAGVGIRTFFRHFEDMEALFAAADEKTLDHYESLFDWDEEKGSLTERIDQAVRYQTDVFERVRNYLLSTQALLWRSQVLVKNYARNQRKLRENLESYLPELLSLPNEQREAIDAIASFELWHRLRVHQGLSKKASQQIVSNLIKNLIAT